MGGRGLITHDFLLETVVNDGVTIGNAIEPRSGTGALRITVAFSAAQKLGLTVDGGTEMFLNANANLVANALYTFTLGCRRGSSYVFAPDGGNVTVLYWSVEEINTGVL